MQGGVNLDDDTDNADRKDWDDSRGRWTAMLADGLGSTRLLTHDRGQLKGGTYAYTVSLGSDALAWLTRLLLDTGPEPDWEQSSSPGWKFRPILPAGHSFRQL